MAITRLYTRTGTQANAGTKLDEDLDQIIDAYNAHEADTTAHGATGAVVGTTNVQDITNKTVLLTKEAFTASAAMTATTHICAVTTLGADLTITIPSSEIGKAGRLITIIDEVGTAGSTYDIIIATQGAETINGNDTVSIVENYGCITLESDGTNLFIKG